MTSRLILIFATLLLAWGCGGGFPEPKQALADAESASRSAREVGADSQPAARLEVKLADEQIAQAKALVAAGDNERATFVLLRARADAELAIALSREQSALGTKEKAIERSGATFDASVPGGKP